MDWKLASLISDPTGADTSPAIAWDSSEDLTNLTTATTQFPSLYSYYEGEYIEANSTATVSQVISTTQFLINTLKEPLNSSSISGINVPLSTTMTTVIGVAG